MGSSGKHLAATIVAVLVIFCVWPGEVKSSDYPHSTSDLMEIECEDCHFTHNAGDGGVLIPPEFVHTPQNIDDTATNSLCWSCHNDIDAKSVETHSSYMIDASYGNWTVGCWVCHDPHKQEQADPYDASNYLWEGNLDYLEANGINKFETEDDPQWDTDEFAGLVVYPDKNNLSISYKILSNTGDSLFVEGPVDCAALGVPCSQPPPNDPGTIMLISYGKLVRRTLNPGYIPVYPDSDPASEPTYPKSSMGLKTVKFTQQTGSNSFADGDGTYDGICEVCHEQTDHFRHNGGGDDPLHTNVGSPAGGNCLKCHDHRRGFGHGGGRASGCDYCHGHDPGYYGPGSGGVGTYKSHSTHTENDEDDARGPNVSCFACHAGTEPYDFSQFPYFKSGVDANMDGKIDLSETDVCNNCHSPDGSYDGVNDPDLGAKYGNGGIFKYNWLTRVYSNSDNKSLRTGMEKWCATCHDEVPSVIDGVTAPNVIGDEDDSTYTYSIYAPGYGYYKTGHGLPGTETYPASGGITLGAGLECDSCHDFTSTHVDGDPRTYSAIDPTDYRKGYRLSLVSGREPMKIPRLNNSDDRPNTEWNFPLCAKCHGSEQFTDPTNFNTNFITQNPANTYKPDPLNPDNRHEHHMVHTLIRWSSDWSGTLNSLMNCPVCHNVHGSTRMTMIRDGKLINNEPGLEMWYYNEDISTYNPTTPADLTLSASTGTTWKPGSAPNVMCTVCHGGLETREYRLPYSIPPVAPTLEWTGESGYTLDGVVPDSGPEGSEFVFRVKYVDLNNDPPSYMRIKIDLDDSSTYEGIGIETFDMTEVDPADDNYMDGKLYTNSHTISAPGGGSDNILAYSFEARDGADSATGSPTGDSSIRLFTPLVSPPLLEWVTGVPCEGESVDLEGVTPRIGFAGVTTLNFYVKYTGAVCPPAAGDIQVWIDLDGGGYSESEQHDMVEDDSLDTDCTDGKVYKYSTTIGTVTDTTTEYTYQFYAFDGSKDGIGVPTEDHTVTVLSNSTLLQEVDDGGSKDHTTIQAALDNSNSGTTVLVYPGTYPSFYIGHWGSGNSVDDNDLIYGVCGKDVTIANGGGLGSGNVIGSDSSSTGVIIDGLSITNGDRGVGLGSGTSITLRNSAIHNNGSGSTGSGGALFANGGGVTLEKVEIYSNEKNQGGGLYFNAGTHVITDSIIRNNRAVYDAGIALSGRGGGFNLNTNANLTVARSYLLDNTGDLNGGAVYSNGSPATFVNTVFEGNSSTNGGVAFINSNTHNFTNCTITGNSASSGGVFYMCNGLLDVRNSIFWQNSASGSGHNVYKGCNANNYFGTITDSDITTTAGTYFFGSNFTGEDNEDPAIDPLFIGGGDFHLKSTSPAIGRADSSYAPTDDIDGHLRDDGSPDWGADEAGTGSGANTVPVLAWTGEPGYVSDAVEYVDPDFEFRVKYTDDDNDPPVVMQLWIDEDDNGYFDESEKHDFMGQVGDGNVDDGEIYTWTRSVSKGDGTINYMFHATDGTDLATGDPTLIQTLVFANSKPALAWSTEPGYGTDGVDPDSGEGGSNFTFRVDYTDIDDDQPAPIQVWIDLDDSETYEDSEKFDMGVAAGGDGDFTNGEPYFLTRALAYVGDGTLTYRFYASDSQVEATDDPTQDKTVSVTVPAINNVPVLSWVTGQNCLTTGARPPLGTTDSEFEFMVMYTDDDNQCPTDMNSLDIQVWVDQNGNGSYDTDEKYDLVEDNTLDLDCTTGGGGKLYKATVAPETTSAGTYTYRFYATDGLQEVTTGDPITGDTVTVFDALKVRPAGGVLWFDKIQDAVDYSSGNTTILVWPNSDFTAATYSVGVLVQNLSNTTLRSVCGRDFTIIDAAGAYTVYFIDGSNMILDGFTVTGGSSANVRMVRANGSSVLNSDINNSGSYGIEINDSDSVLVENTLVNNNNEQGIYIYTSTGLTVSKSEFYNNTPSSGRGGGIYFNTGNHTVIDSIIRDNDANEGGGFYYLNTGDSNVVSRTQILRNTSVTSGGGIYTTGGGTDIVLENCVIARNEAVKGGGVYSTSGHTSFTNSTIANNNATGAGGGAYASCNGSNTTVNSLFWGNTTSGAGDNAYKECGTVNYYMTISNSVFSASKVGGAGNIQTSSVINEMLDPAFLDEAGDDYHLGATSPYIDAAGLADPGSAPLDDIDAIGRPMGAECEVGADEYLDSNTTITENATAVAISNTTIEVTMPYSGDLNGNNTYTVQYNQTGSPPWIDSVVDAPHTASPFIHTIDTGLTEGEEYYIQVTYSDTDGVAGENPKVIGPVSLPSYVTTAGIATAVAASSTSIDVSMPYTGDANDNNTYSIYYGPAIDGPWTSWDTYIFHRESPFEGTITGLSEGGIFYIRFVYNDEDGVNGADSQVVGPIYLGLSGTVYTDAGITPIGDGATVGLIVNGTDQGIATTTGGEYGFDVVLSAGDAILVYVDEHVTDGTTVTVSDGNLLTGLDIYGDSLITRHDNSGSVTSGLMDTALGGVSDTEILYTVTGSDLTVNGVATELYIPTGYTFEPGGTIVSPNVMVKGSLLLGGELNVTDTLEISGGTLDTNSGSSHPVTVDGNLTQTSGQVIGNSSIFTVAGDLSIDGVVDFTASDVVLTGTGQSINGSIIFNNLTKTVGTTDTLTFEAGETITISGHVELKGASGQLLNLTSSTGSSAWNFVLNGGATMDIDYVNASWSDASSSSQTITPTNSIDGGNNVNWIF